VELRATVQRLAKADFLHGLGIAIGLQDVSFVHVAKRFVNVSLLSVKTTPLPETGPERLDELARVVGLFLQDMEVVPDQVVLSLPRRSAYVSRLIVPETARDVLPEVIDYQSDRLLPIPKEDVYTDYVTFDVGTEERRIEVTLFAFVRQEVEAYLAILQQAQLRPQTVTLSSAALTNALAFCHASLQAPCLLVVQDDGWMELDSIGGKRLVASQMAPLTQNVSKAELDELLAQTLMRSFPGVPTTEALVFLGGVSDALPLLVDASHDLQALTATHFALTTEETLPPAALPALGAALQAIGEGIDAVNLLPKERRAQREKRLSPFTLLLGGMIALLCMVWLVSAVVQRHRVLRTLSQQQTALQVPVGKVQTQEDESTKLQARLKTLDNVTQKKVILILRSLTEVLPERFYLNHFRYKDGDIEMSGLNLSPKGGDAEGQGAKSAADLLADLENSPCLRNVAPKAPFTRTPQGETFTLGAQAEPCNE
jgi:Tfp pilus assembly protein PilN